MTEPTPAELVIRRAIDHLFGSRFKSERDMAIDASKQLEALTSQISTLTARLEAADRYKQISECPMDGTPVIVRFETKFRFMPYKRESQEYKHGKRGRWQEAGEYGGWQNTRYKPLEFRPVAYFAAADKGITNTEDDDGNA